MKSSDFFSLPRYQSAAGSLLLGLALITGSTVQGQNLLKNPGFNSPLSTNAATTTNWVVGYVYGGKEDFALTDRTTWAKRTFGSTDANGVAWGAQFRPLTEGPMEAYFRQVVTNLTPAASYVISGYMFRTWTRLDIIDQYIETVGGSGTVRSENC